METEKIPDNFNSVILDFTKDLSITYPEYSFLWSKWMVDKIDEDETKHLFEYCLSIYPERFFDILYQNNDIFNADSEINTTFLPNVDFKLLFNCEGVSENTKKTIWKYLQLILFTIVGGVKDKATFGETMNMFDGIDESELNEKLKETMSGISEFFSNITGDNTNDNTSEENNNGNRTTPKFEMPNMEKMFEDMNNNEGFNEEFKNAFNKMGGMPNMPNMENMQDHLKSLFDGKIGSLAKDMAEEISEEFQDILGGDDDVKDTSDVLKKMMKNPKKIMDLMKTISGKLDTKMQNGEISRDEIMKEASDLFGKMKDMGGTDQFTELFKNMAKNMGGMGKNMRMDTNALNRMTKQQSTRERLLKKLEAKRKVAALENEMRLQTNPPVNYSLQQGQQPNNLVFKLDGMDNQEKSYIHPDILAEMENESKKPTEEPKKKSKKKKGKK
jgi:hypothetical protein